MPTDGTLLLEQLPRAKHYMLTGMSVFFSVGAVLSVVDLGEEAGPSEHAVRATMPCMSRHCTTIIFPTSARSCSGHMDTDATTNSCLTGMCTCPV